jgi:TonB family protein
VPVFNFNEVDEVTETTEDPRRPVPLIEASRRDAPILGSLVAHVAIVAILFLVRPGEPKPIEPQEPVRRRAFLLPKALAPLPPAPRPAPPPPPPMPTPPPPEKSARISIGEASDKRAEVLRLERDRDIGRRGTKVAQDKSVPQEATPESQVRAGQGQGEDAQRSGLPLPVGGARQMPRADDSRLSGPSGGLLSATTRSVERSMRDRRDMSQMEISGFQMGPLFFDPEGADFTRWINHFKGEVYRNWIIPEPARLGVRGQVGIEFTVERGGRMTRITPLSSSGMIALDRAASNALEGSILLPLPNDYPAGTVTMRVTFVY